MKLRQMNKRFTLLHLVFEVSVSPSTLDGEIVKSYSKTSCDYIMEKHQKKTEYLVKVSAEMLEHLRDCVKLFSSTHEHHHVHVWIIISLPTKEIFLQKYPQHINESVHLYS